MGAHMQQAQDQRRGPTFGGVIVGVLPPPSPAAAGGGVSLKLRPRSSMPPCTFFSTSICICAGGSRNGQ